MARSAKPRKRKSLVRHSEQPRYVVKLHDVDDTGEEAAVLRFDEFDDAVNCCADLSIPFFVDAGNKKLVFWIRQQPERRLKNNQSISTSDGNDAIDWFVDDGSARQR